MGRSRKPREKSEKYQNIDPQTLYVENLPKNITEDEVVDIFAIFAKPSRVFLHNAKSFAFVGFENKKITTAVIELARNRYPEFDIKPAVQRSKFEENNLLAVECINKSIEQEKSTLEDKTTNTERAMTPPLHSCSHTCASAEAFQSRSPAEERLAIIKALETVHKMRTQKDSGFCSRCSTLATKQCANCGEFYCSEKCQLIDWILHQDVCMTKSDFFKELHGPGQRNLPARQPINQCSYNAFPSNSNQKISNGYNKRLEDESERRALGDRTKNRSEPNDNFDRTSLVGNDRSGRNDYRSKRNGDSFGRNDDRSIRNDDRSGRNDDKKSYDDRQPRSKSRGSCEESESKYDSRNDDRLNRTELVSRRDYDEPGESWESSDNTKSKMEENSSPQKLQNSPKRRSPPRLVKNFESEEKKAEIKPLKVVEVKKESPKVKEPEQPKSQTISVIGLVRESKDSYWVFECKDIDSLEELQSSLQEICENAPSIKPEVGLVCGCFYDDSWYRGKIVSVQPQLVVHYIDFGNTSECKPNIKKLPKQLTEPPGLAFLIKFDKGTPAKYEEDSLDGEKFSVHIVKETETFYLIRFAGEDYSSADVEEEKNEPPKKRSSKLAAFIKPKRRNVWDSLKEDMAGFLHITCGIGRIIYGCLVPVTDEEAVLCFDSVSDLTLPKQPGISAKIGDLVLSSDGKELSGRGQVLCKAGDSYIINLVDYGQCIKNKQVHPLPDSVANYPELGVKVHIVEAFLNNFNDKFVQKEETYFFEITGPCENNKWPCLIKNTDEKPVRLASGFVEKWNPLVVKLSYEPIESGSLVLLSSLTSLRTVYVRPSSKECDEKLESIGVVVNEYSSSAKKCQEPPWVGEMVCARFLDDGNFYRAVVESIQGDSFNVRFVDYGNKQATKLADLLPMPKELQQCPCFATKINLKGIEKGVKCTEASRYLSKLNSESQDLIMTYEGKEVILKEKGTGVVVNDYIKEAILRK